MKFSLLVYTPIMMKFGFAVNNCYFCFNSTIPLGIENTRVTILYIIQKELLFKTMPIIVRIA